MISMKNSGGLGETGTEMPSPYKGPSGLPDRPKGIGGLARFCKNRKALLWRILKQSNFSEDCKCHSRELTFFYDQLFER